MTLVQLAFHGLNFILPALFLALTMPIVGLWVMGSTYVAWSWRVLWHVLVGSLVLVLGFVIQGQDGAMMTYMALVLTSASLEWLLHRGWSRH